MGFLVWFELRLVVWLLFIWLLVLGTVLRLFTIDPSVVMWFLLVCCLG